MFYGKLWNQELEIMEEFITIAAVVLRARIVEEGAFEWRILATDKK